ncbi:MAG: FAD-dependent oxidoreductase [Candidatus Cloacimonetes bacterium]|jgi:NADPH-dependent 2,4-dienoyl-CoA reductase/sulfur reductase-like enzyme/NAD-dependent dihydropyrimidine dehydrogenase PreA subunit/bacterioferritin-associated ferredoxin|nr:FAD-dependent oxidoreductase [Candidatus Cloacimonadota bacterium]
MRQFRIEEHPILDVPLLDLVSFYFNNEKLKARKGEMISSALIANGINVFGHHHKDGSAQGIFCANGQCAKCTVIANGIAVKSCMTPVCENMIVQSAEGLAKLAEDVEAQEFHPIEEVSCDVLIIGGGPAGLSAATELGKHNVDTLLIDDKNALGGKLVLQTHKFFGSEEDSRAGTRGHHIGKILAEELAQYSSVRTWVNSTALFVFSDKKVGVLKEGVYKLVSPQRILNAAGAREKFLRFPGNKLARIYGAGAFQTLVNRDLVRPTQRLFIIGGGNVGLIAGYHALQAGIEVVGLAEAMPACGGYKVHADKLRRFGVPIYTSHSILCANGDETVESITITQVDEHFKAIKGSEKTFACDTILIAVGLDSLSEFTQEAEMAGIPVDSAGDALEIAEASSAMFNGKIAGLKIAKAVKGNTVEDIPDAWYSKAEVLKAHPGAIKKYQQLGSESGVMPVIHCLQEIPCNPCTTVCPTNSIQTEDGSLLSLPRYTGSCIGCGKCLLICPGLAITLVDYRKDAKNPIVTIAYEISNIEVKEGDTRVLCDIDAEELGEYTVESVTEYKKQHTSLVRFKVPSAIARRVAGFRVQDMAVSAALPEAIVPQILNDDAMVCLCERVTVGEVRSLIRKGINDLNQIKAITRAGMGPCGAKTCEVLIKSLLREEGVPVSDVVPNTKRPIFVEVPLGTFPGGGDK